MVEERPIRSASERLLRGALGAALSRRSVFGTLLRVGQWARPLLPQTQAKRIPMRAPFTATPAPRHARRMVLLQGCVQPALAPNINAAAARVFDRLGVSLVSVAAETCCGALSHHLGAHARALAQARRNVDAWTRLLDDGAEAIVMSASGCGVMVKDYRELLRHDDAYAARASRVSAATRDLCELLAVEDIASIAGNNGEPHGRRVAWQSPCTLQHGQKLTGRVEPLLEAAGFSLLPVRDPHLCCGSAGTYSLLQRELAVRLRAVKLATLQEAEPDVIATANIGCLQHLGTAAKVPVKHWIELIDEASAI
jgi:glycolate oxidase iron-sulfur subunit